MLPEPRRDKSPVTARGELWLLGDHKLYVGDARDPRSFTELMAKQVASAVFTDPPYNVPIDGFVTGKGRSKHSEFEMASGNMSKTEFQAFLSQLLVLMSEHSPAGSLQ